MTLAQRKNKKIKNNEMEKSGNSFAIKNVIPGRKGANSTQNEKKKTEIFFVVWLDKEAPDEKQDF